MKALTLLAPADDVKPLLRTLQHFGCIELTQVEEDDTSPVFSGSSRLKLFERDAKQAYETLSRYAPQKTSFLAPKRPIGEATFWDKSRWRKELHTARKINSYAQTVEALVAKEAQLEAQVLSLEPWKEYSLPLEYEGTANTQIVLGTLPAKSDLDAVKATLEAAADLTELFPVGEDKDLKYIALLIHKSQLSAAVEALHSCGFTSPVWKDLEGTVTENQAAFREEILRIRQQRTAEEEKIAALGDQAHDLQDLIDCLSQYLSREEAADKMRKRGKVVMLQGWMPAEKEEAFGELMASRDCAWELREPTEDEYPDVPVKLKNNILTNSLNMVTEMYSLPAYNTLDPNPLMAPFFILFYGIMMADMGYGLLMILFGTIVLAKKHPEGTLQHLCSLMTYCGISTFIFGALTGGFFGDFIPQLLKMINPASTFELPALFTPLADTSMIMIGSMALGAIQIITGMAISVIQKCKRGRFLDALWNEITWWIVFAGIALMVLKGSKILLIIGGIMVLVGSGWEAKGFGKVTAVFASLYNNVTGYGGDILSYLRLMALMLSGSVIATVFNTIGAIFGNVILFVIIALVGNMLNFALNILGCYVHDLRLQCLEYFGKFYEDGGKPFNPLKVKTDYVDIKSNI